MKIQQILLILNNGSIIKVGVRKRAYKINYKKQKSRAYFSEIR